MRTGVLTGGRSVSTIVALAVSLRPLVESMPLIAIVTLTGIIGGVPDGAVTVTGIFSVAPEARLVWLCPIAAATEPDGRTVRE